MEKFHLLLDTRQSTEYSCGASALQTVLSYWGKDLGENELMKLLNTTSETGTYPEDIMRVARELGFKAEVKENLTLGDVEESTKRGNPVIVLGQAWRSRKESEKASEDDWEDGHYVVVLEVDKDYVYFEDPYIRMGKGFLPRKTFEEYWHNIGGKTPSSPSKQMHLGIFIEGEKRALPQSFRQIDVSKLDFSKIASLQLAVVAFKGELLPYDLIQEVKPIFETGLIRPVAYIFLHKDKDGKPSAVEGGNVQEGEEITEINALIAVIAGLRLAGQQSVKAKAISAVKAASEGDFGLQVEDILTIGDKMPADSSVMVLLIEHFWAKNFKDILRSYGGVLVSQEIVTEETLAKLGDKLAKKTNEE